MYNKLKCLRFRVTSPKIQFLIISLTALYACILSIICMYFLGEIILLPSLCSFKSPYRSNVPIPNIIFSFDTIAGPCNNLNFPPIPLLSSTTNWFECVVISASPIPPTSGINSILLNLFTLAYCGIIFKVVPIETPIISPSCIIRYKYLATSAPNSSF